MDPLGQGCPTYEKSPHSILVGGAPNPALLDYFSRLEGKAGLPIKFVQNRYTHVALNVGRTKEKNAASQLSQPNHPS
jgi:hypothetical protein